MTFLGWGIFQKKSANTVRYPTIYCILSEKKCPKKRNSIELDWKKLVHTTAVGWMDLLDLDTTVQQYY